MKTDSTLDAARWARLKDHLADLASLTPDERNKALEALDVDTEDRLWLQDLANPLLSGDQRLSGSHPSARAAVETEKLRWRHGETIGRYRIESLLGRGGMGEVYEARSLDNDQIVALKVLRAGLDQKDYARFSENEQRALRRLDDPRIAKFLEAFIDADGGPCLVLEWVDGEPLQSYCRGRRFNVDSRLRLFVEVCHAVASAHQQLVVHRDLKPSNVLVTPDGQVKLLDFGVSKLLDREETGSRTQTHGHLFTLDYAAPEQVLHEPVSTATDIYALGVLLFRLLTDVSPYPQRDGRSLVKSVLEESPQKISEALVRSRSAGKEPPTGSIDADLDRVIGRAMDKDAKSRYRSALELALDVQAVLDGRPISGGGSTRYRFSKFVRRNRASVVGAIIALAAIVGAAIFSVHETRLTARHAHEADVANRFLLTALDLTDKFSSSNPGDVTLGEVLERAVAKARTDLADEPEVRATVLLQLSTALMHRGNTETALSAAQEAYQVRSSDPKATGADKGEAAQELGSAEIERGQIEAAGRHLREALALLEKEDESSPTTISTLTSLGKLASLRGDAKQSLAWYLRIRTLREALSGDHRADIAMDYNNVGTGYYNLSQFHEADAAFLRGIAILESRFGKNHPRLGYVLYGRAATLVQLGRFSEALTLLDRSDAILNVGNGLTENNPGGVASGRLRAVMEYYSSDYPAALQRLRSVLPRLQSSSPVGVIASLSLWGRIEIAQDKPAAAVLTLAEVEKLLVDSDRGAHVQRWLAHGLHGTAAAKLGDALNGDKELEEAFQHLVSNDMGDSIELAEISLRSGAAARRRGDFALALKRHQMAESFQKRTDWLGEFGKSRVIAELVLDGQLPDASADAKKFAQENREAALATLQRFSPHNALVTDLLASSPNRRQ
ncbi:MAG: serine/threonine-protein kinase [Dokdonella sp.]